MSALTITVPVAVQIGAFLWDTFGQGVAGNEAHRFYLLALEHWRNAPIDSQTGLPANHDLLAASRDALCEATLVLVLELAGQLDPKKPWIPAIVDHVRQGKLWKVPLNEARNDPHRQWLEAFRRAVQSDAFVERLHDRLMLTEDDVRACVAQGCGVGFAPRLATQLAEWAAAQVTEGTPPPAFRDALAHGWRTRPGSAPMTLGQTYCLFFREHLKRRPEVFRIYTAALLGDVLAKLNAPTPSQAPDLSAFERWLEPQLGEIVDLLVGLDQHVQLLATGQVAMQAAQGEILVAVVALAMEVQRGNAVAQASMVELLNVALDTRAGVELLVEDAANKNVTLDEIKRLVEKLFDGQHSGIPAALPLRDSPPILTDISRIDRYAPVELIGREAELALLDDAWSKAVAGEPRRPHVLTFVALGGEGKTSLVAKWLANQAHNRWPGCEAAFAWSFYSQGTREQMAASSDLFLKEALAFFGDNKMAASAQSAFDKGRRLAQLVGQRGALLILDGLEPLQYAPTSTTLGELKDQGLIALLKGLAANSRGVCIVTTRYSIPNLKAFWQTSAPEVRLLRLSRDAGVHLLKTLGVEGSKLRNIPFNYNEKVNEFEKLVEDVKGHALTLNLLGTYLRDAHAGDIRKRDLVRLEEADAEEQGGHAFRVMDAYVESFENGGNTAEDKAKNRRALALLQLLGLFDRPATAECLNALWNGDAIAALTEPLVGISDAQRNVFLKRLEDAKLITVNREEGSRTLLALDAHPLIREYFAQRLRAKQPEAWRAAHRCLYEHLRKTTPHRPRPTLEELQPFCQAIIHGCRAGLHENAWRMVYMPEILREIAGQDAFYMSRKLGAIGSDAEVVACFFEQPWSRPAQSLDLNQQAWLFNQAAHRLRAMVRTNEALFPMQQAVELAQTVKDSLLAAIACSGLSSIQLTLGDIESAIKTGERAIRLGDQCEECSWQIHNRSVMAEAQSCENGLSSQTQELHDQAEKLFKQERKRVTSSSTVAQLSFYSLTGFRFFDIQLGTVETATWWKCLGFEGPLPDYSTVLNCNERWALKALDLAQRQDALITDKAFSQLTLGRIALYRTILGHAHPASANSNLQVELGVADLRSSGRQDKLPRGLLTRSWLRFIADLRTGPESAQADLDEAWEIAERGPMRLHMADIHLYRARLFHAVEPYPWNKDEDGNHRGPKDDLAAARKLIEQCGYWRRKGELEDAEEAAKNW